MSYRFMRVLIFYDLPTITGKDRREHTKFRKFLIKNGFMMIQESIYSKLALNATVANSVIEKIRSNKPQYGIVQLLLITEKQFSKMEFIVGDKKSNTIDTDERLIIL